MRDRDFRDDSNGSWSVWLIISIFCFAIGIGTGLFVAGVLR